MDNISIAFSLSSTIVLQKNILTLLRVEKDTSPSADTIGIAAIIGKILYDSKIQTVNCYQ